MPRLVLKIDVDTLRGTREGVPNLVRLLQRYQANATFLFSLGPDHTGWAIRRAFKPGFFSKVSRTSVVEHYGFKTLMYGVLLPAPDIGRACASQLRAARDAGFECGTHTWDHVVWQDNVRRQDADWTHNAMQRAFDRFVDIFDVAPKTHGAAGWQMNPYAFARLDDFGITHASDTRAALADDGSLLDASAGPYRISASGKTLACVQLPTTLPTLDELLGRTIADQVITPSNVAASLLRLTAVPRDHVYTLHAELEGQKLAPIFERLLSGWKAQGYQLVAMADYFASIRSTTGMSALPVKPIQWGTLPGRSGDLLLAA